MVHTITATESLDFLSFTRSSTIASTLHTKHVHLQIRATSSESDSTTSATRRSSSSSSHTSKCTDKQQCQTGTNVEGTTIAVSIVVPVVVFLGIIAFFFYRSYRKGKKEAESDNDPDFYGETTILPDYPKASDARGGDAHDDNHSYYSMNPFKSENTRYPAQVMQPPQTAASRDVLNKNLNNSGDSYYETFSLPYQHTLGSKHSLDEYAKHLGSEFNAYNMTSRPASRIPSRTNSPYSGGNTSTLNFNQKNSRVITREKTLSNDDPTTDSSITYNNESKYNNDSILDEKNSHNDRNYHQNDGVDSPSDDELKDKSFVLTDDEGDSPENVFQDPYPSSGPNQTFDKSHVRNDSDLSYVENEPETIRQQTPLKAVVPASSQPPVEAPEDDEDEDIKRMKSVYKVYFDRENSIKVNPLKGPSTKTDPNLPPLPSLDDAIPTNDSTQSFKIHQREPSNVVKHELEPPVEYAVETSPQDEVDERVIHQQQNEFLSTGNDTGSKQLPKHRAVSSIYSTIPFNKTDSVQLEAPYQPQQYHPQSSYQQQPSQYPQQQQQQYHPQQPPQNIYRPPYQQSPSGSSLHIPQAPVVPPAPLQALPTPHKMDYDSVITSNGYAPTKSLTGGTRPPALTIKPFNPLHYSDQIFQASSPSSPQTAQFGTQQILPPGQAFRDVTPPSPHHIRQSIVMVNPVEIGKQKIYRPAGSFSQYNSENGSRSGSITSQTAYQEPNNSAAELLPKSGSQADLRKQLGGSENYNFN